MKEVYLVFKGWDDHDCQPFFESVFSTFELAVARARFLEEENTKKHMKSHPKGTITWEDAARHSLCLYYRKSEITFGLDDSDLSDGPYPEEVIYIIKAEVDENV